MFCGQLYFISYFLYKCSPFSEALQSLSHSSFNQLLRSLVLHHIHCLPKQVPHRVRPSASCFKC
jgi:hypothetical protein